MEATPPLHSTMKNNAKTESSYKQDAQLQLLTGWFNNTHTAVNFLQISNQVLMWKEAKHACM